jgi:hypothetical protein
MVHDHSEKSLRGCESSHSVQEEIMISRRFRLVLHVFNCFLFHHIESSMDLSTEVGNFV